MRDVSIIYVYERTEHGGANMGVGQVERGDKICSRSVWILRI